ncbi:MAG TPA: arginine deiminase-related protein [Xanthobacteraceae bacterium]
MILAAAKPRFLMCPPDHFAVSYAINPWMDPASWARDDHALAAASLREWAALRRTLLGLGAAVELVAPLPGLPDLVFTANAAVVLDRKVVLARFRHAERQGEEQHIEAAFRSLQARGLIDMIRKLPEGLVLEGAGDCVWDQARNLFWMGYGPRSDVAAREPVADIFGAPTLALKLADARFYHMDTAFCPLPRGEVMFVPDAFTRDGRATIHDWVEPDLRIEVAAEDAGCLAANAVCLGDTLVMSGCGAGLRLRLAERGYRVLTTPLHSFLRSGGAAFCLTLRLDRMSRETQARRAVPVGAA